MLVTAPEQPPEATTRPDQATFFHSPLVLHSSYIVRAGASNHTAKAEEKHAYRQIHPTPALVSVL